MTAKGSRLVACIVVWASLLAHSGDCLGKEFHSATGGYTLEIPDDWVEMVPDESEGLDARFMSNPLNMASDPEKELFVCHTVVRSYANFGVDRQFNEKEIQELIRAFSKEDIGESYRRQLHPRVRDRIANVQVSAPLFNAGVPCYSYFIDFQVTGSLPLFREIRTGYFGCESIVEIRIAGWYADVNGAMKTLRGVTDSFRFDADHAYMKEHAVVRRTQPSFWRWFWDLRVTEPLKESFWGMIVALVATVFACAVTIAQIAVARFRKVNPHNTAVGGLWWYQISGCDRDSGKDVQLMIEAPSENDACEIAFNKGVLVGRVNKFPLASAPLRRQT